MARKKTPAPDAQVVKSRIIDTAERLFREVGYAKTTVADIAGALAMSPANVYRYFSAKAAINEAICERLVVRIEDRCREVLQHPGSATERLTRMLFEYHRVVKEIVLKDRRLHDMVSVAVDEHWAVVLAHSERMADLMAVVLGQGMASGEFRGGDPGLLARSLHEAIAVYIYPSFVEHLVEDACQDGGPVDTEDRLRALLDLVFGGLASRP